VERILKQIKEGQYSRVEVLDYDPKHKDAFRKLNSEWIQHYFELEEQDERVLSNPDAEIIAKGGHVFFARIGDDIVGTAALLKVDSETYEIAKMAVAKSARGRQVGRKLADACLKRARELGAAAVVLKTDHKLKAAVSLYRKLGFEVTAPLAEGSSQYRRERTGFAMRLDLREV